MTNDEQLSLYQSVSVLYVDTKDTFPTMPFFRNTLFSLYPDNTWPSSFLDYLEEIENQTIPTDHFPALSDELRRISFIGKQVWDTFISVKKIINNEYNPFWNEDDLNKSGCSLSDHLDQIRYRVWEKGLENAASKAAKNQYNYCTNEKKNGKVPKRNIEYTDVFTKEMHVAEILSTMKNKGFQSNEYDTEYLTFLMCGKPAGDYALQTLVPTLKKRLFNITSMSESSPLLQKQPRRVLNRISSKSSDASVDSIQSTLTPQQNEVTIIIKKDIDDYTLLQNQLSTLNTLRPDSKNKNKIDDEIKLVLKSMKNINSKRLKEIYKEQGCSSDEGPSDDEQSN